MVRLVAQQPTASTRAASRRTHSDLSVRSEVMSASSASGYQLQSTLARHRTALRRSSISSWSLVMRAQAPAALEAGALSASWLTGGQQGLMHPPVARLKGRVMLPSIWPRQQLQSFALHLSQAALMAANCLALGRIIPMRLVAPPDPELVVVVDEVVSCAKAWQAIAIESIKAGRCLGMAAPPGVWAAPIFVKPRPAA